MLGVQAAVVVVACACILRVDGLYSSFYEPLYNSRVLGYRVEAQFRPQDGVSARELYWRKYGYRGERLIAALGHGGVQSAPAAGAAGGDGYTGDNNYNNIYGDVNFYYT